MKITKRQLRRIIREEKEKVIAENTARKLVRRKLMVELFGLFGGGDKKALKAMSDVANEISMGESEIKTAERSGPEAVSKVKRKIAAALMDYAGMLEKADEDLYADHLDHPGLERARSGSDIIKAILASPSGSGAADKAMSYADEMKGK